MKTSDMSVAQLWRHHFANPQNTAIRAAIALRDPSGAHQLWPIQTQCIASRVGHLEAEAEENADALQEAEDAEERAAAAESKVEDLEEEIDSLKEKLAEAVSS